VTCGAEKTDGEGTCGLPAGWGRETDDGPCRHHVDDGDGGSDRNDRQRGESARESVDDETSPGRADTFNDVAEKRILDALRDGATMELAARAAGISPRTLRRWRDRHETFNRKVQRAKAEAGADALDTINEAASDGDWRAASWILEKRFPDQYGETSDLPQEEVEAFVETVRSTIRQTFDDCETAGELLAEIGEALEEATDG
jgi:hypothetical protein